MSRSRKKHLIIKAGSGEFRRIHNRRWRRRNRQQVNLGKEPFLQHEIGNQYDVCDYRLRWTTDEEMWMIFCGHSEEKIRRRKQQYYRK